MPTPETPGFTAFLGSRCVARGTLPEVARAAAALQVSPAGEALLAFDAEGRQVELDLRGTPQEAAARADARQAGPAATAVRGRGRPQLGVVAREVTLLPRHWEWLAAQSGGASVTLRRLVEEARRAGGAGQAVLRAQESAYRFLTAIAGNLPGYEDALRALFARDLGQFSAAVASWPQDLRDHAHTLAAGAFEQQTRKT